MTLSEFKEWYNNYSQIIGTMSIDNINFPAVLLRIKEKLASVGDGFKCKDCDYILSAPIRCYPCHKAHLSKSDVPRGTLPEIAPVVELCHYCKKPLFLVMPHQPHVIPPVPHVGVCSVCHLYQP